MNILVVDNSGDMLDFCMKLQGEKNDVRLHIKSKTEKDIGDGIISKVSGWSKYIDWAELIVFANSGFGGVPKKLRSMGKNVIGGTAITDRIIKDQEFADRILDVADIKRYNKKMNDQLEVSIGGWFNGKRFLRPIALYFKENSMFDGDRGYLTEGMGISMIYKDRNKLFTETLERTSTILEAENYVGFIGMDCIISNMGSFVKNWIIEPIHKFFPIQDEVFKNGWTQFLMALANASTKTYKTKKNNWCCGIAFVTKPWPFTLLGYKDKDVKIGSNSHIHLCGIAHNNGKFYTAGCKGLLGYITGHGKDLEEAMRYAYSRIESIYADEIYFRTDIGCKLSINLPTIRRWGYLSK